MLIVRLSLPAMTTAVNGKWNISGGSVKHIKTLQAGKTVEVNNNTFLVYGINKDTIFGDIEFEIDTTGKRFEIDIKATTANAEAEPNGECGYYRKQWTYRGVRKQLIETY